MDSMPIAHGVTLVDLHQDGQEKLHQNYQHQHQYKHHPQMDPRLDWFQLWWICSRWRSSCTAALPGPTLAAAVTTRERSSSVWNYFG